MIASGFKSVGWVAAVGAAALGCYMLSLNVAAERAELAKVERQILAAKQDIRSLQTELGTRGRLTQLEHWNSEVLALSAPSADQFLQSAFILARFSQPERDIGESAARVRMASADTGAQPQVQTAIATDFDAPQDQGPRKPMLRQASFVVTQPAPLGSAPSRPKPAAVKAAPTKTALPKPATQPEDSALLGDALLREIGAAAKAERKGGAGAQ